MILCGEVRLERFAFFAQNSFLKFCRSEILPKFCRNYKCHRQRSSNALRAPLHSASQGCMEAETNEDGGEP